VDIPTEQSMNIQYYIKNVEGLILPKRANSTDAGYDVIATTVPIIKGTELRDESGHSLGLWSRVDYVEYGTNLYIVPDNRKTVRHSEVMDTQPVHTDLRPRSSISSKTNFVLANSVGLIDRGYHDQVMVRFKYIFQPIDFVLRDGYVVGRVDPSKMYKKGDAIAQILPMLTNDINFNVVDVLPGDDRGGGFGSTDKKKEPDSKQPKKVGVGGPDSIFFNGKTVLGKSITISQFVNALLVVPYHTHGVKDKSEFINKLELWARSYDGDINSYTENGVYGICVVSSEGDIIGKFEVGMLF